MWPTVLQLVLFAALLTPRQGPATPFAAPASPLVGDWQLNLDRTHYGAGVDRRRRERMTCTAEADKIRCIIRSTRSDGRELRGQFIAAPDGVAGPVTGMPDVDQVQLHRPNVSLIDATFLLRGNSVFGYRAFQSADGRSLMILSVDVVSGAAATTLAVYDRR